MSSFHYYLKQIIGGCPSYNSLVSSVYLSNINVCTGTEGQSKYKWISELGHGHGHTYLASRRCIYPYRENIILIDDSATLASSSSCTTENILIRYNVKSETTFENSSGSAAPLPVPDNIHLSGVNRPSIEENTGKGPVNAGGNRALYVDVDVDFEAEGVGANSNSNSNRIDSNKSNHSTGSRNVNFTDKVNIRTYSTNIFENDSYTSDVQLKEIDRGVDRDKDKSIQTSDNIGNIQVVNDFMGLSQISIPSITTTDNFSILIPVNPSATNSDTAIANSNNSPVGIPLSVPLPSSLSFGNGAGISTSLPLSIGMLHTLDSNDQERYAVRDHSNNGLEAERILSGLSLSAFPSDSYSSGCGCWGAAGMGRGVGSAMQVLSRLHSYSSDAGYCVGKGLETRSAMQYELDPGSVGCKGARDRSRSSGSIGSYDFYKYGDVTDDDTCMSDGDG